MYKIFSKLIIIFVLSLFSKSVQAQLLDSLTLDTLTGYISIQEALKNPEVVTKLVLRKQHLKSFPKAILQFKNLQYLDISKNSIDELPDSIDVLKDLQYFACSKTGLKRLPKQIGKLTNLKYLNCNQNDLDALPPQIGNLEKLEYLDLWSNNFEEYPSSLASLKSLRVLDLRNILISDETQAYILRMLPNAKVYMSPSCKCKW
ncbi:MAG: leucine-rich repeat domain-containing protein [Bacteroidetes bacterium]|nr:leucine-rich repeat domain-containing protein [Bacteroidota bacterium]